MTRAPRLDQALVARGLAPSRARASAMIYEGAVRVDGQLARRASQPVGPGADLAVAGGHPWVGRAALKLVHALDSFGLVPAGRALDLGASTGGFTQVLLARGAAHVDAVDVGHGQLHPDLAADPRVTLHEGVNARDLPPLPPPDWITADLSFISLRLALPPALALAEPGAALVALIKPQFEAGPGAVGKGGIVRDPAVRARVQAEIAAWLAASGWPPIGVVDSPIAGGDGNREALIAARKG